MQPTLADFHEIYSLGKCSSIFAFEGPNYAEAGRDATFKAEARTARLWRSPDLARMAIVAVRGLLDGKALCSTLH